MTKVLCLEGITGAGKTILARNLEENWGFLGRSSKIINEKEYEPFKQIVLNWHILGANQIFNVELIEKIAKVRGETHRIHFNPLLGNLDYMLFDRSFYTSAIYQADGELNPKQIIDLNIQGGAIVPERGVVLICSPDVARRRIDERRLKVNMYNLPSMHESLEEIAKRRGLYIELVKQHPELYLIDTTNKSEDEVFEEVKLRLEI